MRKDKIAIVVQRYGTEIGGGAEYHARLVARMLAEWYRVEVWTTTALDYVTWKPAYPKGWETIEDIPVNRFDVLQERCPQRFGDLQKRIQNGEHALALEREWMHEQGPLVPHLLDALDSVRKDYRWILFFSYRYYHAYYGIQRFSSQALLVPTVEHDDVIEWPLFRDPLACPAGIFYNTEEERDLLRLVSRGRLAAPGVVVGVGSEIPPQAEPGPVAGHAAGSFLLYLGRIDPNKGVMELMEHHLRFLEESGRSDPVLLLAGKSVLPIPEHRGIRHLGFVSEEEKYHALRSCMALAMPSPYESLSMVTLEAWAMGRPVLANGRCAVLKGQCRRGHGGLWYDDYPSYRACLERFLEDGHLASSLGQQGRAYFQSRYTWSEIRSRYRSLLDHLER